MFQSCTTPQRKRSHAPPKFANISSWTLEIAPSQSNEQSSPPKVCKKCTNPAFVKFTRHHSKSAFPKQHRQKLHSALRSKMQMQNLGNARSSEGNPIECRHVYLVVQWSTVLGKTITRNPRAREAHVVEDRHVACWDAVEERDLQWFMSRTNLKCHKHSWCSLKMCALPNPFL